MHRSPTAPSVPAPPAELRVHILGPLRVTVDGADVEVGPPQQQAVLCALLARAGRPVSARALVQAVWGADAPALAVGALRTHVSQLRRLLEPTRAPRSPARLLVSAASGYALMLEPETVDLAGFDRCLREAEACRRAGRPRHARLLLVDALALWRGEPLAGIPGPEADSRRTRLGERRLAAIEARWEVELESGELDAAITGLSRAVQEHPLRERLPELLMTALYRSGRQAEALDVYARIRRALSAELSVDPGPELARLQRRILVGRAPEAWRGEAWRGEAWQQAAGQREAGQREAWHPQAGQRTGTAPAGPVPPQVRPVLPAAPPQVLPPIRVQRLPPAVPDFVGREEAVTRLSEDIAVGRSVTIGAISGMSGVGKTALALQVAHRLRAHFPDGVFFVDLFGHSTRPVEPGLVLRRLLRALGEDDHRIPEDDTERAALYRSLLADRRLLIVLDNARDPARIRDLLPGGPGCAVLVTSRTRLFGLPGATSVDLRPLTAAQARSLLVRLIGEPRVRAEEQAAARLIHACGYLPLAVRVVGARLAARLGQPIARTTAELVDEERRLADLSLGSQAVLTTFRLGIRLLDAEHGRAFQLLSLPDAAELTLAAAASLLDRTERDAENLCEALVDLSLLESPSPGRYRFHDLLRIFARQTAAEALPGTQRDAALARLS